MGKTKTDPLGRRQGETFLQWRARVAAANQNERAAGEPIVPLEAQRHGDYHSELVVDPTSDTRDTARTLVNRGGTPVCRWIAQKRLSQRQQLAISYVTRLWRLTGLRTALTANYGERLAGSGSAEMRVNGEVEARKDLHRIKGYVPKPYFDVFENVVRHGMAAGTAGEQLGHTSRNAKHTAYLTVCFVADLIVMKERL